MSALQYEIRSKLTAGELLAQLSTGEKRDLLCELCGGSHLSIYEIRRVVNSSGYDEVIVREEGS